MFITDDQNSRRHGLLQVVDQLIQVLQILRFLYYQNLIFGHHRIAFCTIDDGGDIRVCTVQNRLVKLLFGIGQYTVHDVIGDAIDIIVFFSHQEIDGSIDFILDVSDNLFVGYFFCHDSKITSQISDALQSSFRR